MQQLDIFEDSRDRVLVNRLAEAVLADDAAGARTAALALQAAFPSDRHLPAAALLAGVLEAEAHDATLAWPSDAGTDAGTGAGTGAGTDAGTDAGTGANTNAGAEALRQRQHIEQHAAPAAHQLLGHADAPRWLAARWCALARRAAALPYHRDHAGGHAAALWLQAGAWAQAATAAEAIESWPRRPQPLAWVAQARWHLHGADAAWPLLAALCWLAPARVPPLLALLPDAAIGKLARRFQADAAADLSPDPAAAWAWWPAWLLVEQPLLVAPLSAAVPLHDSDAERAFALLRSLLHLERQGRHHDRVAQRRQLLALSPVLFRCYMATR